MKPVLFVFGWIAFALGIIGAFLPVIPTTPFLILAAFLFSKSSPRFHQWLLELPLAGQGLRDWNESKVIRPQAKILCGLMILGSMIFISLNPSIPVLIKVPVGVILTAVLIFVTTRNSHL